MIEPKVSLIVATYNEKNNIRNLLLSCTAQTYKNIELIVVDSERTSDGTSTVAQEYTSMVFIYGKERSSQRNYGVRQSSGDYVLILDADMTLDATVVSDCVKKVTENVDIKALIIPEISFGENFWAKCRALERSCYIGDDSIEAARFFSRNSYLELGGFNSDMISGEDWDLTNRIRKKGWHLDRIESCIHHNEGSISYFGSIKKKLYYSKNAGPYIEANIGGVTDVVKYLLRPAYFKNIKKLVKDPVHTAGFLFLKYSEFFVGGVFAILLNGKFWKRLLKLR